MRVFGNLMNRALEHSSGTPQIGMGATVCMFSDRHAGTVVEVGKKAGRPYCVVQRDKATRLDSNGQSESQDYSYERDPNGQKQTFTLRKNGAWRESKGSNGLRLGSRDEYYDFGF